MLNRFEEGHISSTKDLVKICPKYIPWHKAEMYKKCKNPLNKTGETSHCTLIKQTVPLA